MILKCYFEHNFEITLICHHTFRLPTYLMILRLILLQVGNTNEYNHCVSVNNIFPCFFRLRLQQMWLALLAIVISVANITLINAVASLSTAVRVAGVGN